MVNKPLIRPAISSGADGIAGVPEKIAMRIDIQKIAMWKEIHVPSFSNPSFLAC